MHWVIRHLPAWLLLRDTLPACPIRLQHSCRLSAGSARSAFILLLGTDPACSACQPRHFSWWHASSAVIIGRGTSIIGKLTTASESELSWEHQFTPNELTFFRGHRVGKVPLLPGTCYIELARVVVVAVHGPQPYSLRRVKFQSILFLDDVGLFGSPHVRLQLDRRDGSLFIASRRDS
eukprot:47023-Prymnesium_polylepis.1